MLDHRAGTGSVVEGGAQRFGLPGWSDRGHPCRDPGSMVPDRYAAASASAARRKLGVFDAQARQIAWWSADGSRSIS